jgi:hypothetical protein
MFPAGMMNGGLFRQQRPVPELGQRLGKSERFRQGRCRKVLGRDAPKPVPSRKAVAANRGAEQARQARVCPARATRSGKVFPMTDERKATDDKAAPEHDKEDLTDAGPHRAQAQPGQDLEKGSTPGARIRPAGRKEMDLPPEEWSKTDEEADASFPASDPPSNF